MKTKKLLVASLVVLALMFINISILVKGNEKLSLNLNSLQRAMADEESQTCGIDCYNMRTTVQGDPLTTEVFKNGCSDAEATLWENPVTCCR